MTRHALPRARAFLRRRDAVYAVRRGVEERLDQVWADSRQRFGPRPSVAPFDGDPRLALVTVNFSTTRYLKLMLCTLGEQHELWFLRHLVIVDNASRDGGPPFLRALAARVPRVHVVERRHALHHATGMRAGVRALDRIDRGEPEAERSNVLLFCDTDVVFRDPTTLLDLSATLVQHDGAFVGESRQAPPSPHPDVQASFFAVRRDVLARRDIRPLVHHGSPAFALQWSVLRAGLAVVDFPSNHGGYVLHRGRAGVDAAATYSVGGHARVPTARDAPHFMGVPDGAAIWADVEAQWAPLLEPDAEAALLDHLAERFAVLGSDTSG